MISPNFITKVNVEGLGLESILVQVEENTQSTNSLEQLQNTGPFFKSFI